MVSAIVKSEVRQFRPFADKLLGTLERLQDGIPVTVLQLAGHLAGQRFAKFERNGAQSESASGSPTWASLRS